MKNRHKQLTIIILSIIFVLGIAIAGLIIPDVKYSDTERRVMSMAPVLSVSKILDGSFMKEFEDYSNDQIPGRNLFLKLKAFANTNILGRRDNDGYYKYKGFLSKLEYPLTEKRLERNVDKLKQIYNDYISGSKCSVTYSIIPDKNYYLAPMGGYPLMDYERLNEMVKDALSFGHYVDLYEKLSIDDYYRTDQHWRQENLQNVVSAILESFNLENDKAGDYTTMSVDKPFFGAYALQSFMDTAPDSLKYLDSKILENCIVESFEDKKVKNIYDLEKAYGEDSYDMFLSGAQAYLTIENPGISGNRELVIFRDSFGSSLAPLLAPYYSRITLIDLRYMNSRLIPEFLEFNNQDVLFLYSSLTLNNSITM